jgi:hypothetical protein
VRAVVSRRARGGSIARGCRSTFAPCSSCALHSGLGCVGCPVGLVLKTQSGHVGGLARNPPTLLALLASAPNARTNKREHYRRDVATIHSDGAPHVRLIA